MRELENLSRRYMQEMIPFVGPRVDVMAPDMGTNEQVMAWFMDTYSMYQGITVPEIVTGKPVGSGGTLGRREATGHGVAFLSFRAMERLAIDPSEATAIVQGFGNVGSHAALALARRDVKIVGVSDHTIAYYDPKGFDIRAAADHVASHGALKGFADAGDDRRRGAAHPALRRACPLRDRAGDRRRRSRAASNAASSPRAPTARRRRRPTACSPQRNDEIFVIPDILCNAGGVIVSYFEWVQDLQQYFWSKDEVMERLERALDRSWGQVVERAPPRRNRQPHRGAGDRRRTGAQGEAREGAISLEHVVFRLKQPPSSLRATPGSSPIGAKIAGHRRHGRPRIKSGDCPGHPRLCRKQELGQLLLRCAAAGHTS